MKPLLALPLPDWQVTTLGAAILPEPPRSMDVEKIELRQGRWIRREAVRHDGGRLGVLVAQ